MPTIRLANESDAPAMSALVAQLGYPAPAEVIPSRITNIGKSGDAAVYVAEDSDGNVVGMMATQLLWTIHIDPPLAWLTGLVVLESARGRGIGSLLLGHAEEWARQKGAQKISLSTALHREETHVFYDNRAYERSGMRFTKKLGEG